MKDEKLLHVGFLIPSAHMRDALLVLAPFKIRNLETAAYVEEEAPLREAIDQVGWVAQNVVARTRLRDLKPRWLEAGFHENSFYAAVTRAVKARAIRSVKKGVVAPVKQR